MRTSVIFFLLVGLAACKDISVELEESEEVLVDVPAKEVSAEAASEEAVKKAIKTDEAAKPKDEPASAKPKALKVEAKAAADEAEDAKAPSAPASAPEEEEAEAEEDEPATKAPAKKAADPKAVPSVPSPKPEPSEDLKRVKRGPGAAVDVSSLFYPNYETDDTTKLISLLENLIQQSRCCDNGYNGYPYYGCGYPYYGCGYYGPYYRSGAGLDKELPEGAQDQRILGTQGIWQGAARTKSVDGALPQLNLGSERQLPPGFGGQRQLPGLDSNSNLRGLPFPQNPNPFPFNFPIPEVSTQVPTEPTQAEKKE